ncbi:beta-phosphoglucomutase family hydrolase [Vibrio sp.]|nr:beta-phosphoglucomutase family hydrolase [Vibrio sp.]
MSIDLAQYKGLIFDMDGTLVDSMPAHIESWRVAAEHFGFPYTPEWFHARGGKPSGKIALELNELYGLSLVPEEVSDYKQQAFRHLEFENGRIEETCSILFANVGYKKIAVGTGSKKENALMLLEQNDLLNSLDAIVTANDVELHKPHPQTFLKACELIGLQPEECVVFEDTALGMQAAHAGGMDCILVTDSGLKLYPAS